MNKFKPAPKACAHFTIIIVIIFFLLPSSASSAHPLNKLISSNERQSPRTLKSDERRTRLKFQLFLCFSFSFLLQKVLDSVSYGNKVLVVRFREFRHHLHHGWRNFLAALSALDGALLGIAHETRNGRLRWQHSAVLDDGAILYHASATLRGFCESREITRNSSHCSEPWKSSINSQSPHSFLWTHRIQSTLLISQSSRQ